MIHIDRLAIAEHLPTVIGERLSQREINRMTPAARAVAFEERAKKLRYGQFEARSAAVADADGERIVVLTNKLSNVHAATLDPKPRLATTLAADSGSWLSTEERDLSIGVTALGTRFKAFTRFWWLPVVTESHKPGEGSYLEGHYTVFDFTKPRAV